MTVKDLNGRDILVGDRILFPVKGGRCGATIEQGTVKAIKRGNSSALGGSFVWKLSILPDNDDHLKSHQWPKHCIVIDNPVIKDVSK